MVLILDLFQAISNQRTKNDMSRIEIEVELNSGEYETAKQ